MTVTEAPPRTLQQRTEALNLANKIRSDRAQLKRELRQVGKADSLRRAAAMVADPPPMLGSMRIDRLVKSCRWVGKVKANQILRDAVVSPTKTVAGLSDRQRREISSALLELADRREGKAA